MLRTFGIEEELMLLDPLALSPLDAAASVIDALRSDDMLAPFVTSEYLASQLEFSSPPCTSIEEAIPWLHRFRGHASLAANAVGALAASVGVPFRLSSTASITASARYGRLAEEYGHTITAEHQINALHVHVGVSSRAEGIAALNRMRIWLPVLLALSGNSPFWRGSDTGFASWRSIEMRRWITNGCPPVFADEEDYSRRTTALVGIGGTTDLGTIAWNARLSENNPTLEIRVFDAQLDAGQTAFLAAISRAVVETAVRDAASGLPVPHPPPELLDSALWLAARDGVTGRLLDPVSARLASAREVTSSLRVWLADALADSGDGELVEDSVERLLQGATGAERQRRAMSSAGVPGFRKLLRAAVADSIDITDSTAAG
jgi:carboxylate-amine ligase